MPNVRIIRHEAVKDTGSYEVRVAGLRPRYFYWDDLASRRLRSGMLNLAEALELAKTLARGLTITSAR